MGRKCSSIAGIEDVSTEVGSTGTVGSGEHDFEQIHDLEPERPEFTGCGRDGHGGTGTDRGFRGKPFLDLDPIDLAWLSGLLEGEGYFGLVYRTVKGHRYRYARVGVAMTDRDVVERAAHYFNRKMLSVKPSKPGGRPQFRAVILGTQAVALMKVLHPHMGERRRTQIEEVLHFEAARKNPNELRRAWSQKAAAARARDERGRLTRSTLLRRVGFDTATPGLISEFISGQL